MAWFLKTVLFTSVGLRECGKTQSQKNVNCKNELKFLPPTVFLLRFVP